MLQQKEVLRRRLYSCQFVSLTQSSRQSQFYCSKRLPAVELNFLLFFVAYTVHKSIHIGICAERRWYAKQHNYMRFLSPFWSVLIETEVPTIEANVEKLKTGARLGLWSHTFDYQCEHPTSANWFEQIDVFWYFTQSMCSYRHIAYVSTNTQQIPTNIHCIHLSLSLVHFFARFVWFLFIL